MAIKMIDSEWCALNEDYRCSFIMDSESEVSNLPECCPGSDAFAVENGGVLFMVNASGEWVKL